MLLMISNRLTPSLQLLLRRARAEVRVCATTSGRGRSNFSFDASSSDSCTLLRIGVSAAIKPDPGY